MGARKLRELNPVGSAGGDGVEARVELRLFTRQGVDLERAYCTVITE